MFRFFGDGNQLLIGYIKNLAGKATKGRDMKKKREHDKIDILLNKFHHWPYYNQGGGPFSWLYLAIKNESVFVENNH